MRRILVVDDERLVADTLQLIFTKNGFQAEAVYSAEQALARVPEFQPELLLCDITMPGGLDGIELIERMAKLCPGCRVIVLTGYYVNLERVAEQSRLLGRSANVLTKPCQPVELLREAGTVLNRA